MYFTRELNAAYWALRFAFGVGVLVAGFDKFTNILVNWERYLSTTVQDLIPIAPTTFMQLVGVVEIVVGLCILGGLTRAFGYIAMIWMFGIASNLIMTGTFYDIAVRDILLGIGAYSLARLTEARLGVAAVTPVEEEYRRAA